MSQVIERAYDRINGKQIVIPTDGNAYLLQVPFPSFGFLTKVLVQQAVGTNVAFTVNVLNSNCGLPVNTGFNPASLPNGWQNRRVVNPLAGVAGQQAQGFTPAGNPFRNLDGPDPVRTGSPAVQPAGQQAAYTDAPRAIYILLQPVAGAGANSQWEVAINGFTGVGG
jgi:hypothetical protein